VAGLAATAVLAVGLLLGLGSGRRSAGAVAPTGADTVLRSMETVLRRQGLAAALDSLALRADRDSTLFRDGHQMAHALGREAVAEHGGDATVVRQCSPVFASGCYHGVVEAAIHTAGRIDMPRLEELCVGMPSSGGPGPGFECIHGLGHGILGALGYDIQSALRDCDALSTPRRATSCHLGAFMEAINTASGHAHHTSGHEHPAAGPLAIDPADPYSPCRAYRDPYAASCWLFQGFVILRANDFDAGRALRVCDAAPDGRAARCYEGVGHQLTGLFQRGDRWTLEQCAEGAPSLAAHCAAGAALALDAMDWSGSRAARLCAAARAEWKEACYRSAAGALTDLAAPDERARLCAKIEASYMSACREAAGLARTAAAEAGPRRRGSGS
jgi:hypothetical protein